MKGAEDRVVLEQIHAERRRAVHAEAVAERCAVALPIRVCPPAMKRR